MSYLFFDLHGENILTGNYIVVSGEVTSAGGKSDGNASQMPSRKVTCLEYSLH